MSELNMKFDEFIKAIKSWRDLDLLERFMKFAGGLFYATGVIMVIGFWVSLFSGKLHTDKDLICVEAKAKGYQLEQCGAKP